MHGIAGCWKSIVRGAVYSLILYASFAHNIFCIPDGVFSIREGFRTGYVGYDSDLVVNRVALARDGTHPLMPLYWFDHQRSRTGFNYTSQFGLQGIVLGAIYRQIGGDAENFCSETACVFAASLAFLLAMFFLAIARQINPAAADCAVLLTACSPILLPFATSLYWMPTFLFAPFVATWLLFPLCRSSYPRMLALSGLMCFLVACKCLCGYEYVTTVILAPVAAAVYHLSSGGVPVRRWLAPSAWLVGAGLIGFAIAVAIHSIQLHDLLEKDPLALIGERATGTTLSSQIDLVPTSYACLSPDPWFMPEPFRTRSRCLTNYFWMPVVSSPTTWGRFHLFASLGFASITAVAAAFLVAGNKNPSQIRALIPTAIMCLVAALSWHLLALNHTSIHFHLNLICYFIPFVLIIYVLIACLFSQLAARARVLAGAPALIAGLLILGNLSISPPVEPDQLAVGSVEKYFRGECELTEKTIVLSPIVALGSAPTNPNSELCFNCRLRSDFNRGDQPCWLIHGWTITDPVSHLRPTLRIVATRGGKIVPIEVGYARITLLERIVRGRASCSSFAFAIPISESVANHKLRIFAVTGSDYQTISEVLITNSETVSKHEN